jgi:hypothetical protein
MRFEVSKAVNSEDNGTQACDDSWFERLGVNSRRRVIVSMKAGKVGRRLRDYTVIFVCMNLFHLACRLCRCVQDLGSSYHLVVREKCRFHL